MTWPNVNDRVVLHGRVDEVPQAGGAVYVELDRSTCISSPTHSRALVRTHKYNIVPELTPHILLRTQWWDGAKRNQVMLIGTIVDETPGGLVQVEFSHTEPLPSARLTFHREKLVFGRPNDR